MREAVHYVQNVIYIIEGFVLWAWDEVTGKATKRALPRLDTCHMCGENYNGICGRCGCIIKAKVRVKYPLDKDGKSIGGCPDKKW